MRDVVIAGACRTAIGTFGGGLKDFTAIQLGTIVIAETLKRAGVVSRAVDETLMGHVHHAGRQQHARGVAQLPCAGRP